MCQQNLTGPYPLRPCHHGMGLLRPPRARSLLQNSPLAASSKRTTTPCAKSMVVEWPADLNTACSRTCLTKPFQCCKCLHRDDKKQMPQVGWTCARCGHVRCCLACTVWAGCGCGHCEGAGCRELVLQLVRDEAEGKRGRMCDFLYEGGLSGEAKKTTQGQKKGEEEAVWWKANGEGSTGK
ncbi:hypothetical protein PG997_010900 [Apiospora hydei]|uniref:Uncharacterized protein n=1 Tax=Apiospora hydei TaxID=1337664 RepID=A0ABR1VHK7_9PEZI